MNTDFARDTLLSCPALWGAVLEFNGAFCVPPEPLSLQNGLICTNCQNCAPPLSPVPPVAGLDASALWQRVAARRACSRRISPGETFWDFSQEQRCVALLSAEDLVRLGTLFGAAVHARELRLVVLREEVRRWQEALGRDVWAYALGRGQYQAGLCAALFEAQGGLLSLHPAPAGQALTPAQTPAQTLTPAQVLACGWAALQTLHRQWPEAVRRRVGEKWATVQRRLACSEAACEARSAPSSATSVQAEAAAEMCCAPGIPAPRAEAVWPLLRKILHKELSPAWIPYFS